MKDYAKKHPINKPKTRRVKTSLRAKRKMNQPLQIKHLIIIAAMSAMVLFASNLILQTDVEISEAQLVIQKLNFYILWS